MMRPALIALLAALAVTAGCSRGSEANAQQQAQQADAAATFLAANAKAPGVQSLPSGVQYKVVRSGPAGGAAPKLQDEIKVHYEGKLVDGTVFDSSYQRGQPAIMPLEGLIPAWQEALTRMKPGDEWTLWVPPAQGYGPEGKGPIPPNSVLVFRIELLGVLPAATAMG